jgi:hypothetical protein
MKQQLKQQQRERRAPIGIMVNKNKDRGSNRLRFKRAGDSPSNKTEMSEQQTEVSQYKYE